MKNIVKIMMDRRTQEMLRNLESRSGVHSVMMEGNYCCKLLSSMVGVLTLNVWIIQLHFCVVSSSERVQN